MTQLANRPQSAVAKPEGELTFKGLLESKIDAIRAVASKALDATQLIKMVGLAASRNPRIAQCTPLSVLNAVMTCAELNLYPSATLGTAYFVPYLNRKNREHQFYECQLIVGYRGMCTLARRSGEIVSIQVEVVREGDEFELEYGLNPIFRHKPKGDTSKPVLKVWALAMLKGGGHQMVVMSREEIEAVRERSRAADSGPWVTDTVEMAKKTAIRRLCKLLPLTPEVENSLGTIDRSEVDLDLPDMGTVEEEKDDEQPQTEQKPAGDAAAEKLKAKAKKAEPEPKAEQKPIPKTNGPMSSDDIDKGMN